jgi:hypothetical protein
MMKRVVTIIGLCLACAMPAVAGIHYKSRSFQEGKGASKQMDMTVESWVDGDNAKILFTESKNDLMGKDSYLVTTDGGKIIYLVDPKEKTYTEWDLDAMMNMFGAVMESMGGMLQMEFSDPEVEKLLEESGGTVVGLPTTHYRYRTAYTMDMKIMGMKRSQSFETVQDIWSTEELADPALRDVQDEGFSAQDRSRDDHHRSEGKATDHHNHDRGLRVGSDDRLAGNLRDSGRL